MFWEVLLGSRLGFRWWSPGSLVFYPVVLIGELLGLHPLVPSVLTKKPGQRSTLRLCDFQVPLCQSLGYLFYYGVY